MDFLDEITLTAQEAETILRYKGFGDDWVKGNLRAAKARKYIAANLNIVSDTHRSCGRCCSEGTIIYSRKDGGAVTDNDVTAALAITRGQVNKLQERKTETFSVYWLCDSSD